MGKMNSRSGMAIGQALLLVQLLLAQQVFASGIFELNLSALVDAYGRDLRLDCCAWQNSSGQQAVEQANSKQQQQHQQLANNLINYNYQPPVALGVQHQQQQQAGVKSQQDTCDPTKCQLIVRICVKNYQTQIDPSQCTFGELTAQVMRPSGLASGVGQQQEQLNSLGSWGALSMSSLARLQQQQQLAALQKLKLASGPSTAANIHHQRMLAQQWQLQQQQQLAPFLVTTHEQHTRLYHQARAMRQVAFDQPISFPFNFTWPVSRLIHLLASFFILTVLRDSRLVLPRRWTIETNRNITYRLTSNRAPSHWCCPPGTSRPRASSNLDPS